MLGSSLLGVFRLSSQDVLLFFARSAGATLARTPTVVSPRHWSPSAALVSFSCMQPTAPLPRPLLQANEAAGAAGCGDGSPSQAAAAGGRQAETGAAARASGWAGQSAGAVIGGRRQGIRYVRAFGGFRSGLRGYCGGMGFLLDFTGACFEGIQNAQFYFCALAPIICQVLEPFNP
jgi:hypothetical protein